MAAMSTTDAWPPKGACATVHLVRHGEVENPQGVLYGRIPGFHLSEAGRVMAKTAAGFLAGRDVTVLRSSPLERARETAEPIAADGLATLRECTPEVYGRGDEAAAAVAKLAADALTAAGVPFWLQEAGSLFSIFLGVTDPVRDFGTARGQSPKGLRCVLPRHARSRRLPARHLLTRLGSCRRHMMTRRSIASVTHCRPLRRRQRRHSSSAKGNARAAAP